MILVRLKRMIGASYYSKERLESETYRLITVVYSDGYGEKAICERLHDEIQSFAQRNEEKKTALKGDLFGVALSDLRVVASSIEEDKERELYIKELQTLLNIASK